MPTIGEILQTEISFNVGSTLTPLLGKKDEGSVSMPLAKPQGQGSKNNQDIKGCAWSE
jgi:hypothetical protein